MKKLKKINSSPIPAEYSNLKGFYYSVTDEQIREHQQRSVAQIFEWLESTNEFLFRFQSAEERQRMMKFRKGEL